VAKAATLIITALLADRVVVDRLTHRLAEVEQPTKAEQAEVLQQDLVVVVVAVQILLAQVVDLI
jgi:hypothetical protein